GAIWVASTHSFPTFAVRPSGFIVSVEVRRLALSDPARSVAHSGLSWTVSGVALRGSAGTFVLSSSLRSRAGLREERGRSELPGELRIDRPAHAGDQVAAVGGEVELVRQVLARDPDIPALGRVTDGGGEQERGRKVD